MVSDSFAALSFTAVTDSSKKLKESSYGADFAKCLGNCCTIAKIPIEVNLPNTAHQPVYQKIANTSLHLREFGFSNRKIAECLSVDEQTVAKAIQWINSD